MVRTFFIIADLHTKFPIVEKLKTDSTSLAVTIFTLKHISLLGIPSVIISDNGPQFIGKAYQQMVKEYGISHITSSPHHPKSHGFIERMIRTVKGFMRKSLCEFYEALILYRTTPLGPDIRPQLNYSLVARYPTTCKYALVDQRMLTTELHYKQGNKIQMNDIMHKADLFLNSI